MDIDLREPRLEDFDSYHEIFSDAETHHFIIDEGIQNNEGSRKKLKTLIEINGEPKRIYSIVGNDIPLGFIVIHYDETKTPYISYAVRLYVVRTFETKQAHF